MKNRVRNIYASLKSSHLLRNSFWGLTASIFQSLFLSIFFIILAREYSTVTFANFLIASSVCQILVSFSSMGLGQWFIREYSQQSDRSIFLNKFLKIQLYLGGAFFLVNILLAVLLYPSGEIRTLIIILGVNILFDNLIYSFRNLNIAESTQSKSAQILFLDGLFKLVTSCILLFHPISIEALSVLLLLVRFITINLFVRKATVQQVTMSTILFSRISASDFKKQFYANWYFIVIGSLSVLYWRFSNIIISRVLLAQDIVDFEISFKVFSLFSTIPAVFSASLFPLFIKYFNSGHLARIREYYQSAFFAYLMYSILSYSFLYAFSPDIIPFVFGEKYANSTSSVTLMFLSFIVFPTILLQANLIIAMKMEMNDMYFNLISLATHLFCCFIGLYYYKSLNVINYSILISFLVFHLLQDALLIRKGLTSIRKCVLVYASVILFILSYQRLADSLNPYFVFGTASCAVILLYFVLAPKAFFGIQYRDKFLYSKWDA